MSCKFCAELRNRMKRWNAKRLGEEWTDANPPANVQAEQGQDPEAPANPTADKGAAYGDSGVEADTGAGTDPGQVHMPDVQPDRDGPKRTRRSRSRRRSD